MAGKTKGTFRTGTSNVVLPGAKHTFPEEYRETSRLHYYSSVFNSVEVNSSFYKLPMARTFGKWAEDVPEHFQFTVKMSRDVTHAKGLIYPKEIIGKFMEAADYLGDKKGCLLIQFPGSITANYRNGVSAILEEIDEADPKKSWRKAVEFRHNSWYKEQVYGMLRSHGAGIVIHDKPKSITPETEHDQDFIYLRFHGTKNGYGGSYHPEYLEEKAMEIRTWLKEGKDVYTYFNNTLGEAFDNAMTLRSFVEQAP